MFYRRDLSATPASPAPVRLLLVLLFVIAVVPKARLEIPTQPPLASTPGARNMQPSCPLLADVFVQLFQALDGVNHLLVAQPAPGASMAAEHQGLGVGGDAVEQPVADGGEARVRLEFELRGQPDWHVGAVAGALAVQGEEKVGECEEEGEGDERGEYDGEKGAHCVVAGAVGSCEEAVCWNVCTENVNCLCGSLPLPVCCIEWYWKTPMQRETDDERQEACCS